LNIRGDEREYLHEKDKWRLEAYLGGFEIRWVKVKGHSGDEGNNAADVAAGWAQNGGTKGEKDIEGLMQRLRMDGGTDGTG
jgi:ribonuclease HI